MHVIPIAKTLFTDSVGHLTQSLLSVLLTLYIEYAEQRLKYGILFTFSPVYEYSNLECVHVHAIYKVDQAEYGIHSCGCVPGIREYIFNM